MENFQLNSKFIFVTLVIYFFYFYSINQITSVSITLFYLFQVFRTNYLITLSNVNYQVISVLLLFIQMSLSEILVSLFFIIIIIILLLMVYCNISAILVAIIKLENLCTYIIINTPL